MSSRHCLGCSAPFRGLLFRMRGIIREFKRTPLEVSLRGGVRYTGTGGAAVECFSLRISKALLEGVERVMPVHECLTDEEIDFIVNFNQGALAQR